MNLAQGLFRTATATLLLLTGTALAQTRVTVPTLRSTGAGVTYVLLDGLTVKPDPAYTVLYPNGSAEFASTFRNRLSAAQPPTGPIPPWVDDSSTSLWIGPRSGGTGVAPGTYKYQSSFNLTGFDPATILISGRVAADNRITSIRINGFETGFSTGGDSSFNAWTPLNIDATTFPRFNQGVNNIEISVSNTGTTPTPAGLRMEITTSAVPYEGTQSIVGFWNMNGMATQPLQPPSSDPVILSADTPSGSGSSLRLSPLKTYAIATDGPRSMSPSQNSTLAAWVKPLGNAASPLGEILFSYGGSGGYKLWLGSSRRLAFTVYGVGDVYSDITFPTDNQWHHVAAVHRAGSGVTFYLDGVPRDFKPYTGGHRTPANNELLFGYEGDLTLPFNGLLDDVVIAASILPVHQFMPTPAPNLALMGRRTPDSTALLGNTVSGSAGRVVAAAGDVDGDGFADAIVTEPFTESVYIVFGAGGSNPESIVLQRQFKERIATLTVRRGESLQDPISSGDFNGDGLSDLLISTGDGVNSALYIIFGRPRPAWNSFTSRYSLEELSPATATRPGDVRLTTSTNPTRIQDVTGAGDVDGDGIDDILLATYEKFYFLFGNASWSSGEARLFEHPLLVQLFTSTSANASVAAAGDVNGDGRADVLIANYSNNQVILFTGQPASSTSRYPGAPFTSANFNLATSNGRRLAQAYVDMDRSIVGLGFHMAGLGDVNGDGLDDFAIGYHRDGTGISRSNAGRVYVVYGSRIPFGISTLPIATTPGITTITSSMPSVLGFGLGAAGDENGDGLADFLIGNATGLHEGGAFLCRGALSTTQPASLVMPAAATGSAGYPIIGPRVGSAAGIHLDALGDFNGDGANDYIVNAENGPGTSTTSDRRSGEAWIRYGSAASSPTAIARNSIVPANSDIVLGGLTTAVRAVGRAPGASRPGAFTRAFIGFKGGAANNGASVQEVLLRRSAPTQPTTLPGDIDIAPVHWRVTTDRTGFSASTLILNYAPSELEGLDVAKLDVWYTPETAPTATTAWSPLGAIHDPSRRTLTIQREHTPASAQSQFNGTYALFSANLVFEAGSEIPRPGTVLASELPPTGPAIEPLDSAVWDAASGRLFAAKPGATVISWRTLAGSLRATTVGSIVWPTQPSRFQQHLLGTPSVILTNWDVVQLTATETGLAAESVTTTKHFNPATSGRSLLKLTKNPSTTAWLLVNSRRWDEVPGSLPLTAVIGTEIQPSPGLIVTGAPPPFVLTARARYAVGPDYYQHRTNQSGVEAPLIPVNLAAENDLESRLVVAFYRPTTNAIPTLPNAAVPTNFWPGVAAEFTAAWPTNLPPSQVAVIASQRGAGRLDPAIYGGDWNLYVQNDPSLPGFNPNDEHARVASNLDGHRTLMPLRSDLGSPTTSLPFVLLAYRDPARNGRGAIQVYPVVATNAQFPGFAFTVQAGRPVLPPRPISDDPVRPESYDQAAEDGVSPANRFLHDDRKGGLWAKAAGHDGVSNGVATVRFYYQAKEADFFPGFYPRPTNNAVPLLDLFAGTPGVPIATTVFTAWPTNAPRLFIGESLVDAKRGLPVIDVPPNPDGTPGVGGPCSVTVIYDQATARNPLDSAVTLIDPLLEQQVPMGKLPAAVLTEVFQGKLRFKQLPPHLYPRFTYQQTNDSGGFLKLAGVFFNEPGNAEGSYFLPNVISPSEAQIVKDLAPGNAGWAQAMDTLAAATRANLPFTTADRDKALLAVSAGLATGSGWVTIAMQDRPEPLCSEDLPVSLEVFRVEGAYRGEVATILPKDAFDERITFKHKADFAGNPDDWSFEWRLQPIGVSELPPPVEANDTAEGWELVDSGAGKVTYTIGGASPFTLGDNRVIVRYRPLDARTRTLLATADNPQGWSRWTAPKLGEGWVKRVLDGINPYEQRFKDLADPTRSLNTTVNMLSQAGRRWEGNIPLNGDSVDSFGLIEIYETVLRRARLLSIDSGIAYQPANNALLLAASRLSDLYTLLGNEAFADASDPTLAILNSSEERYVNFAPTLHAFQGLAATPDLLAEELALLRGRDDSTEPSITRPPVYNRLRWNTAGELGRVAYMANYDIRDAQGRIDGNIDAADAQFYYPQGHGDAWGHYLSSLKYYYRLAINPLFTWVPRTELDEVNGVDVSVDFAEEQKFIRGAAAKARTGAEIVNLTYRDRFTENPEGQWQGYKDQNRTRAWGVADWATRAGQGAYFDWMLGNALLPEAGPRVPIAGVRPIDRGTQPDFNEITAAYERIQNEVDNADRGLNPLGLERGVMPFDISVAAADGEQTHFEQIYERAVMSLSTAVTTFYYAAGNTQRLRQQADDLASFQSEVRAQEFDFQSRLIEVFGQPYREDIGPGGIYPAGYTGPDYLHYDYIDPSALLGLVRNPANLALRQKSVSIQYTENPFTFASNGSLEVGIGADGLIRTTSTTVPYTVTDAFGITKPTAFTDRLSTGELQQTRSALLQSVGTYLTRLTEYNNLIAEIDDGAALLEARFNIETDRIQVIKDRNSEVEGLNISIATIRFTAQILSAVGKDINEAVDAGTDGLPKAVGTSVDPSFGARLVAKLLGKVASGIYTGLANVAEGSALSMEAARDGVELRTELRLAQLDGSLALREAITELQTLLRNETALRYDLMTQLEGIQQQTSAYQSAITRGFRLLQEFKRFRFETSAAVAKARHKDMAYRVFRNDALQKYRAQFDLAARYTYLAARAYDFETAFLPGDRRGAGSDFLNRIIRSRVIGNMQDNDGDGFWNAYVGGLGDAGLADAMARMNENWTLNLKSQLGFNNTQPDLTRFSLRYDLFQLLPHDPEAPDASSDATWRAVLSSPDVRRANLLTLEAFNRYCIPFTPRDEVNGEPALVIPFSTTVNAGENFFGNPLVENQEQFDSTKFATKIRSVKIAFQGLSSVGLAAQPLVYLIPTGADVLRSPSDPRNIATRQWYILDQAIPVPFPLNFQSGGVIPSALSSPGWIPAINGLSGSQGALRRHGSLRAFDTESAADGISSTRLVGRSVWNTRWLLIIPGRTLFSDPAEGIERFINGRIDQTTGTRSGNGVKDIQIEFETYAVPGS
jgi:hypothetical protein